MLVKCNAKSARTLTVAVKNKMNQVVAEKVTIAPGETKDVPDELLAKAQERPVVQAWFDEGDLVAVGSISEGPTGASSEGPTFEDFAGRNHEALSAAGYGSAELVGQASVAALCEVPGIGEPTANDLIAKALSGGE